MTLFMKYNIKITRFNIVITYKSRYIVFLHTDYLKRLPLNKFKFMDEFTSIILRNKY